MTTTRIFVISEQLMFARGLESLLKQNTQLRLIGHETDVGVAGKRMKELQPDVVIVDSSRSSWDEDLELVQLLRARPNLKVIDVSLQNNNLYIYRATQKVVESVDDLIQAIG